MKTTLVKAPSQLANRTCLQGYVTTTYAQLVKAFGEPHIRNDDRYEKVHAEWVLKPEGEDIPITIYDYRESVPPEHVTCWHIGGNSQLAVKLLRKAFPFAVIEGTGPGSI
jgi:hypothetical protein